MPCSAVSQLTNAPAPQIPASWPTTPAQQSVFLQQLANVFAYARDAAGRQGVNVVPTAYAVYNGAQLPTLTVSGASTSLDTARHQFGLASLKLTATGATVSVSFPSGAVPISAFQRWIASVYLFTSRAAIAGTLVVITANGTYSATITSSTAISEWYRLWGDMSLVGDAATSCTIQLTFTGCTAGDTFSLEGWQLEAASGNTNLPSPFANSAAPGSADFLPDGSAYVRLASSHSAANVSYNYKGVWISTTSYVKGDEVVYGSSYWLALNGSYNSAPATGNANWQVVGSYNGFQGAWSPSTSYVAGAEVTYSGNFWVAVNANTNSPPSTTNANWQIAGPTSLDAIADGTTYQRMPVANMDTNRRGLIDFTQTTHVGKVLDNIGDGSTYARILGTQLSSGAHKLAVSGSGMKLGDQRNNPCSLAVGYGGIRSAQALTASSSGVVSVNAHSVNIGNATVSYNANSSAVSGLTSGATYNIYALDNYGGGSPTWFANTSAYSANANDNVYIAGQVTIPASGTSGGGGIGTCVCADQFISRRKRAGEIVALAVIDTFDGYRKAKRIAWRPQISVQPCVRVETEHGASLECSVSTPFTTQDGTVCMAPALYGHSVLTDAGWERVAEVISVGLREVAHIHAGGRSYAAGSNPRHRIYSHNPLKP
ncbi:MAG: hypothetical protein KGL35_31515 [Bradyrhizobium sp.]|nr:hypothetical protein [Bradyrhizobium sp.]